MKPPIAKSDWDQVHELAVDIVNASILEDPILEDSKRESLFHILATLEEKYGEHPSIIATRGDFSQEPAEAIKHFEKALRLARIYEDKEEELEILDSIRNLSEK